MSLVPLAEFTEYHSVSMALELKFREEGAYKGKAALNRMLNCLIACLSRALKKLRI